MKQPDDNDSKWPDVGDARHDPLRCMRCGTIAYRGDLFCPCCGAGIRPHCPACGAPVRHPIAHYCTACGIGFAGATVSR
jgi:hypothetical protein